MENEIILGWPEWTVIVGYVLGLGLYVILHGQPRKERYNLTVKLADVIISVFILYFGGFWT